MGDDWQEGRVVVVLSLENELGVLRGRIDPGDDTVVVRIPKDPFPLIQCPRREVVPLRRYMDRAS